MGGGQTRGGGDHGCMGKDRLGLWFVLDLDLGLLGLVAEYV